jgi:hypothetical protein
MTALTPQYAYYLYVKHCVYESKGQIIGRFDGFNADKLNENGRYPIFERFCRLANDSGSLLDPNLFVKAMAVHQHGFFDPKMLILPSAFRIYRQYVELINESNDQVRILESVFASSRFVADFCKVNGLSDFDAYLAYGEMTIPALAKHYSAGSISSFFLSCIPEITGVIDQFPDDVKPLFAGFNYKLTRMKVVHGTARLKTFSDNFILIVNSI